MDLYRSNVSTLVDLLPHDVMIRLSEAGRLKSYREGALIQQRGDDHRAISIVMSGSLVAGNLGTDGSFVVTLVLQPGECFGEFTLFAGLPRTHDLSAASDAEVLTISERQFKPIFDSEPAIARALLTITLHRTHDLLEFLDGQRRLTLPVRLAKLLLSYAQPEHTTDAIQCRQEDLAYMLGVTRVSVGKALKILVKEGFLMLGYGAIKVIEPAALRQWTKERSLVVPLTAMRHKFHWH